MLMRFKESVEPHPPGIGRMAGSENKILHGFIRIGDSKTCW